MYLRTICTLVTAAFAASTPKYNITYSTVGGYFLQDADATNASTFDYTTTNFGLQNRTYTGSSCLNTTNTTQWQRFAGEVARLNIEATAGTEYKVIFIGRHGEGYHNAEETFVGTPAWNCYYSLLNGNATATWVDAHLTANGVAQAKKANAFWKSAMATQRIPVPKSFYTSPLYRCLDTANITYGDLASKRVFQPTVKEFLREGISIHTCDHRSNKTYISKSFPSYKFETGFKEHDELWNGVTAEPSAAQDVRSKTLLDDIFTNDDNVYLSVTTHSGEAASLLRVLGHRVFGLSTGAIIPVLVKAVFVGSAPNATAVSTPAWSPSPHCTAPPVTSISGGACVCPNSAMPVTVTLVNDVKPATTTNYHTAAYTYSS